MGIRSFALVAPYKKSDKRDLLIVSHSFKKSDKSKMRGSLFSLFRIQEQFALYERAMLFFYEWALLLFEEKTENWTYCTSHLLALLRVGNLLFRSSLFCSRRSFKTCDKSKSLSLLFTKREKRVIRSRRSLQKEQFALLKRAKERFALFCFPTLAKSLVPLSLKDIVMKQYKYAGDPYMYTSSV